MVAVLQGRDGSWLIVDADADADADGGGDHRRSAHYEIKGSGEVRKW